MYLRIGEVMANKSKAKGNRFEYLLRDMTKDMGLECQRAWGSNGQSLGWHEEVDLLIDKVIKVQAKCRKKIAQWMMPSEEVDIQVIKEDRGIPYVVEPFDSWLERYIKVKELNNANVNGTSSTRNRKKR